MRRTVLAALELSPRRRDVFRRRGLWLRVFALLRPSEYAHRFPQTALLAAELTRVRSDRMSVLSRAEALIDAGDVVAAAGVFAVEAPSLLVRQFRRLYTLASATDRPRLCELLAGVAVPPRVLFALRAQLTAAAVPYPRPVFSKSGVFLAQPGSHAALLLPSTDVSAAVAACDAALSGVLASRSSLSGERVFVDPAAARLLVPTQQRSASDTFKVLERGSRLQLADSNVLRMFVHWTDGDSRSDLDLSVMMFDDTFGLVGQVSWTNLASAGMVHSGDVTSAPAGASEFIDVDRRKVADLSVGGRKVRYVVPAVFNFAGPAFGDLPEAKVGWMLRDTTGRERATFDVKTVDDVFMLSGRARTKLPFAFDVTTGDIIWLDVDAPSGRGSRVETAAGTVSDALRLLSVRDQLMPSVADVVAANVAARGGVFASSADDATLVVGVDRSAQFDLLRPQTFVNEFI
jgi:hypothetical protein